MCKWKNTLLCIVINPSHKVRANITITAGIVPALFGKSLQYLPRIVGINYYISLKLNSLKVCSAASLYHVCLMERNYAF